MPPSAKTRDKVDNLVKGLLGNSAVFYGCEVMLEVGGRWTGWWRASVCLYACGWCVCVCTVGHTGTGHVSIFHGKKPITIHTHTCTNWSLCANPVCMLTLTWGSPCRCQLFFSPQSWLISRHSMGLVKLLFKDSIPHNHLHPVPFTTLPFASIITAC